MTCWKYPIQNKDLLKIPKCPKDQLKTWTLDWRHSPWSSLHDFERPIASLKDSSCLHETRYLAHQRPMIFASLVSLGLSKEPKDAQRPTGRFPDGPSLPMFALLIDYLKPLRPEKHHTLISTVKSARYGTMERKIPHNLIGWVRKTDGKWNIIIHCFEGFKSVKVPMATTHLPVACEDKATADRATSCLHGPHPQKIHVLKRFFLNASMRGRHHCVKDSNNARTSRALLQGPFLGILPWYLWIYCVSVMLNIVVCRIVNSKCLASI